MKPLYVILFLLLLGCEPKPYFNEEFEQVEDTTEYVKQEQFLCIYCHK